MKNLKKRIKWQITEGSKNIEKKNWFKLRKPIVRSQEGEAQMNSRSWAEMCENRIEERRQRVNDLAKT